MITEAGPWRSAAALTLPQAVQRALAAYQRGDWAESERLCRAVLEAKQDHFDALHLLGVIAARTQREREAVELLSQAVSADPGNAAAQSHLGNVLRGLGRPAEALACYERALALAPDAAEAHYHRGNALVDLERHAEALGSYDRVLALKPGLADAYNNRGIALNALKRPAEALQSYERALALRPDFAQAYNNRGIALLDLNRPADALKSFERALALDRNDAKAHFSRGIALAALERHAEALESFERALSRKPDYAEACNHRGMALHALDREAEALESCERALALEPDYVDAHNSRGIALFALKRPAEAAESYERALALDPEYAPAHWNLALCRLLLGDFAAGWQEYEWRLKAGPQSAARRDFVQPSWLGAQSLQGRTILLHSEQGLGDTLQFCRYAKEVAALGATVLLEVQAPLAGLLAGLEGVAQILREGDPLPAFDCHCPLPSLPLAFRTDLRSIPSAVPYVRSDPVRTAAWREKLGVATKPRIGLAWSGSAAHRNDRNRSVPLEQMLPLVDERAEWISLQKEVRASDAAVLASRADIRRVGGELEDFADAAAVVELMDIVVTVDTSIAHLAGAMAKRVWILLPFNPDWRWLLDREDSVWYPTARLFRQPTPGDWASVVRRLQGELGSIRR